MAVARKSMSSGAGFGEATVPVPAGVVNGDLLICAVFSGGDAEPTLDYEEFGGVELFQIYTGNGVLHIWAKQAFAEPGAGYTFSFTAFGSVGVHGVVLAYTGHDYAKFPDGSGGQANFATDWHETDVGVASHVGTLPVSFFAGAVWEEFQFDPFWSLAFYQAYQEGVGLAVGEQGVTVTPGNFTDGADASMVVDGAAAIIGIPAAAGSGPTPVSATRGLRWTASKTVSAVRGIRWQATKPVSASRGLRWTAAKQALRMVGLRWQSQKSTGNGFFVTYQAAKSVSASRGLRWEANAADPVPVAASRALRWEAAKAVLAERALRWDAVPPAVVSASRGLAWEATVGVLAERALRWTSSVAVAAQRAVRWEARLTVAAERALRWQAAQAAVAERALRWEASKQVSATRGLRWQAEVPMFAVQAERALRWEASLAVAATRGLVWFCGTRAEIPSVQDGGWLVGGDVAIKVSLGPAVDVRRGLPHAADGIAIAFAPREHDRHGWPMTATGRVAAGAGPIARWANGLPVNTDGQLVVVDADGRFDGGKPALERELATYGL